MEAPKGDHAHGITRGTNKDKPGAGNGRSPLQVEVLSGTSCSPCMATSPAPTSACRDFGPNCSEKSVILHTSYKDQALVPFLKGAYIAQNNQKRARWCSG